MNVHLVLKSALFIRTHARLGKYIYVRKKGCAFCTMGNVLLLAHLLVRTFKNYNSKTKITLFTDQFCGTPCRSQEAIPVQSRMRRQLGNLSPHKFKAFYTNYIITV